MVITYLNKACNFLYYAVCAQFKIEYILKGRESFICITRTGKTY